MLKFIKENLTTIDGIAIFPLISFGIFFLFFVLLLVWVFTYSKKDITKLSELPFKEEDNRL
ncbi:MAG: CcoQ/FixQ family Cbb3-type cytochrome c oxidase assembly chaperone [Myroides sp.]|jgi:cell division septal protein FtsQ|uniref:Cytochrome C oxidase subunit IV n=1 Tax=Myroides marinus TaxID=703342 RepID=A0A1H6U8P4_9FLAO|nr:cytochrome C oxidase subunit IV [Myroides marinus]MDR0195163.1 CcoQ/FixQ family Cbb3-type cytochrome c oxidase assembly chaperone [Myroides sp.]SEI87896.1 hypothetical protein SAMN04488018_10671 [Myroides marinus]